MAERLAPIAPPGLGEALERGATLPADWYSDPAVLRLERERIFRRAWQYAGRLDHVREPGDSFTTTVGHVPVVVVRDHDGALNGFVNVCRHRAHIVAQGATHRETLQCPYHAWTYGLDGRLRAAPRSDREPGFAKGELSLLPVSVETWAPFVFVNPDPEAEPLAEALGDLPRTIAASGVDLDGVSFRERVEWEIPVNWKIGIENFLECYHCPVAHPGFSKVVDVSPDAYSLSSLGLVSSQVAPVRPSALAGRAAYDPRGEVAQAQFHLVWPATTVNISPGRPNVSVDISLPAGPERTTGFTDYYFAEDVSDQYARELIEFDQQVGREDNALVEAVQRGLSTEMVMQGHLLMKSEQLIHHFQVLVFQALTTNAR